MRSSRHLTTDDQAAKVAAGYDAYRNSAAKQRAWAARNPGNRAIRAELIETLLSALGPAVSGPVLDAGCGSGWLLQTLAEGGIPPADLFGVDLLSERVDMAQRKLPGARIECMDAGALPFSDGFFSLVTMVTILSSLDSRAQRHLVLREVARVTARDGAIVVYEPRVPNPLNHRTALVRRVEAQDAGLNTHWSRSLTVVPALARRLGRLTPKGYPVLARIPLLRTHRLSVLGHA
jgi:ubiquinone/menaquinone biosynthesis C-methylase UbiE